MDKFKPQTKNLLKVKHKGAHGFGEPLTDSLQDKLKNNTIAWKK